MDGLVGNSCRRFAIFAIVALVGPSLLSQKAGAEIIGPQLPSTASRAGIILVDPGDNVTGTQRTTADPSRSLVIPRDGEIQAFNVSLGNNFTAGQTDQVIQFSVLRPHIVDNQYMIVSVAGPYAATANTVNRYPVSVPVNAGDQIGFGWRGASAQYSIDPVLSGQTGDSVNVVFLPISPGQILTFQNLADVIPEAAYQTGYVAFNAEFQPTAANSPAPPDTSAPTISDLTASSKCVNVKAKSRSGKAKSAKSKKKCSSKSTLKYKLSKAGEVGLKVSRVLSKSRGYRSKKDKTTKCKRLSKKKRKKFKRSEKAKRKFFKKNKKCAPLVSAYKKTLSAAAGENSYVFKGKLGKKTAKLGVYEFEFSPVESESSVKTRIRVKKSRSKRSS